MFITYLEEFTTEEFDRTNISPDTMPKKNAPRCDSLMQCNLHSASRDQLEPRSNNHLRPPVVGCNEILLFGNHDRTNLLQLKGGHLRFCTWRYGGQLKAIQLLDGSNYVEWRNNVFINLAIREDPPEEPQPAEELNIIGEEYDNLMWAYNKKLANWEKSNRMCLIYVRGAISPEVIGEIIDSNDIKTYLANIEESFEFAPETHANTLVSEMITSHYDGKSGIRKHILEMTHMENQLRSMDMEISDGFLVHLIMRSLGPNYDPFKINYNTQKEKWTIQELISHSVEEEERQRAEKQKIKDQLNLTNAFDKGKKVYQGESSNKNSEPEGEQNTSPYCHFCASDGHWLRNCTHFTVSLVKKGIPYRPNGSKEGSEHSE
uniref:CCHC-type domain-containing protein n=1 Tax=Oryza nivara TaxID=4536 RepID=A0A0E0FMM5_ORYNI